MLTQRYIDALAYAAEKHGDHLRKGTATPYLSHLLSVSALVMETGGDEDLCIAALLHDAVEDCGGMPVAHEIRARFGDKVADIVLGCSDSTTADPADKDDKNDVDAWRKRKVAYIAHAKSAPRAVRHVSCADKLHNARCILADHRAHGDELWLRFKADAAGVLWYYRSLIAAFEQGEAPPHLGELRRVVDALGARVQAN